MPYTIEYIKKEHGLIVSWEDPVRGDEVIRSYNERFAPIERLKKLRYIITDYSNVSDFDMTTNDIKTIAGISNTASEITKAIYAVAIMPLDIGYGVARMFQAYANDDKTGWHTYVTRNRKDAEDWLLKNLNVNLVFRNPEDPFDEKI